MTAADRIRQAVAERYPDFVMPRGAVSAMAREFDVATTNIHRVLTDLRTGRVRGVPRGIPARGCVSEHGTVSRYRNWGCRCAPCSEVHAAACRKRYAVAS